MSLMLIKYDPKMKKIGLQMTKRNLFQNQKIDSETRYVYFDFNLLKVCMHIKKNWKMHKWKQLYGIYSHPPSFFCSCILF